MARRVTKFQIGVNFKLISVSVSMHKHGQKWFVNLHNIIHVISIGPRLRHRLGKMSALLQIFDIFFDPWGTLIKKFPDELQWVDIFAVFWVTVL